MSLSVVDIVAYVVVVCMAVSQWVSMTKPLWALLPKWLSVVLPIIVLTLPQVADAAGLATTQVGFVQFLVVAVGLFAQGIAAAVAAEKALSAPPPPAA